MAGWQQGVSGQAVYHDGEVVSHDGEVVTFDDAGGWLALSARENGAAWAQAAAGWSAQAAEAIPAAATWSQDATWDAVGQSAEDVTAAATFAQSATWEAEASHTAAGEITTAGTWVQASAAWAASATEAAAPQTFEIRSTRWVKLQKRRYMSAAWGQAPAIWAAEMTVKVPRPDEVEELLLVGLL